MLAVRYRRRYRLCQILTILGVIFLFTLGSFNLIDGAHVLAVILISNALVGLLNLYLLKRSGNIERAATILSGILFFLSISLIITGGRDNTGILWVYHQSFLACGVLVWGFQYCQCSTTVYAPFNFIDD